MKKYRFEIQECLSVDIEATDKETARMIVINRLNGGAYNEEMTSNPYVSDGEEIK